MKEYAWAWQPFGPDESPLSFMVLGSHYRGFPVIKITQAECDLIKNGGPFEFTYKKQGYFFLRGEVVSIEQQMELIIKQHKAILEKFRKG